MTKRDGQDLIDNFLKGFRVRLEAAYDEERQCSCDNKDHDFEMAVDITINELRDEVHPPFYSDECVLREWCARGDKDDEIL